ncbi:D-isomer specific 2-hydroxyacid dehydrogenase [Thermococcus kodakarensis KOD1]|uniref:D-isomer specific 2-hydroxyacid dehydrogenase n=1 Tax=Thermococcus kodakarensis (strain ATCC BAA-918 / JCM 12380 / KOD1) TaxID=69014 RepID=Q5JF48_THEKO|nr:2-hydroxyacid dehydrogenase [Thermococcus kodakarensis]WCN28601.1 2-hydroxyacid dehydrogenase [Thermococcus kodakarensis]WCN30899.1 2-hydroxyacid dehydrogenase [Thermococcus kodakarensis]BAD84740.1 D-isomer specific 2-hydroxyacid dehydrogenase [Thermococcus kodakarensis KOD1]
MRPRVLVTFKMKSKPVEELKKYADVDFLLYPSVEELAEKIKDYDGLIVSPLNRVPREVIERAERLKVISCHSAGYDHVDVEAATKKGIYVTKVSGVLSEAVAEFAVGLTIALLRKFVYTDKLIRRGEWDSHAKIWSTFKDIETVYGKKVGILGMGAIGKAIARRMKAMGTEILYWSRSRKEDIEAEVGAKYLPLDEVLRESDIVILALPATPETYHIINEERIKLLEGKYLVNIGRGTLVDEKAVVKAIEEGRLKGYATDVFEKEPVTEHPLFKYEWETVLTPHHAGLSKEAMEDMGFQAVMNLLAVLRGEIPKDLVNREVVKVRPPEEVKML